MLEVADAVKRLLDAVSPLSSIALPVAEALGHTLAEPVVADRDFPATDRSAMDGFAVRAADVTQPGSVLVIAGEIRAGQDGGSHLVGAGEAIRIFTGAVIPRGADAVVMVEACTENRAAGTVVVNEIPAAGQHVRRRGEDIRAGDSIVAPGSIVRPAEVAALAATGLATVRVVRPPRVAVVSTGDEIVETESAPAPHQVRNSNARMLLAQLEAMHVVGRSLGIAPDETGALDAMVADGLTSDALILSGGVSVGEYDLVGAALGRAGCKVLFHGVSVRPGKPILAAQRGACLVLGLPGNPVSAFTAFQVFARPALRKLMGNPQPVAAPMRAVLVSPLRRRPGRLTYHLAHLRWIDGKPLVTPVTSASSGDVLSLVRANAFVVAAGDPRPIPAGEEVDVLVWDYDPAQAV